MLAAVEPQQHLSPHISKTPAEIWSLIFEHACTDDGTTGCSLSVTSKDIRRLSKRFVYQSVCIRGAESIFSFKERLDELTDPLDKRIKYLHVQLLHYLSDDPDVDMDGDDDFNSDGSSPGGSMDADGNEESMDTSSGASSTKSEEEFDETVAEAFKDILKTASSSLVILSVFWRSHSAVILDDLLVSLENLQELHIFRGWALDNLDGHEKSGPFPPNLIFPRLLRLHYEGYVDHLYAEGETDTWVPFGAILSHLAPRLVQFRIHKNLLNPAGRTLRLAASVRAVTLENTSEVTEDDVDEENYEYIFRVDSSAVILTKLFGDGGAESRTLDFVPGREVRNLPEHWEERWKQRVEYGNPGPFNFIFDPDL